MSWFTAATWLAAVVLRKPAHRIDPGAQASPQLRKAWKLQAGFFLFVSATFFALAAWATFLEWPSIMGPFHDGVVVGFDTTHPNPAHWKDPIVRFRHLDGRVTTFSNFGAYAVPGKHQVLPHIELGEHVRVVRQGGRYKAVLYDETPMELVFLALFLPPATGFLAWAVRVLRKLRRSGPA